MLVRRMNHQLLMAGNLLTIQGKGNKYVADYLILECQMYYCMNKLSLIFFPEIKRSELLYMIVSYYLRKTYCNGHLLVLFVQYLWSFGELYRSLWSVRLSNMVLPGTCAMLTQFLDYVHDATILGASIDMQMYDTVGQMLRQ